jgi:hypothetical protein
MWTFPGEERRQNSTHSLPWHIVEVSGQIYDPAVFTMEKELLVLFGLKAGFIFVCLYLDPFECAKSNYWN